MDPAAILRAAWEALDANDYARCREAAAALDTPDLRRDRPGMVGRALSFAGQAALRSGDPEAAHALLMGAIRLAKQAGEAGALPALRELHGRAAAQVAALQTAGEQRRQDLALAAIPLTEILADPDPAARADRLIRQAGVLLDLGDAGAALERARLAQIHAPDARGRVLAGLLLARLAPPDQQAEAVLAAWRIADAADDQGLIAFAARTARLLGVEIPTPGF